MNVHSWDKKNFIFKFDTILEENSGRFEKNLWLKNNKNLKGKSESSKRRISILKILYNNNSCV